MGGCGSGSVAGWVGNIGQAGSQVSQAMCKIEEIMPQKSLSKLRWGPSSEDGALLRHFRPFLTISREMGAIMPVLAQTRTTFWLSSRFWVKPDRSG
eukprot:1161383-Pelagomonas_calceolata.AAC.9